MSVPRAIIADDERLMREQLRARLREAWPELDVAGEAANGGEALELIETLKPDIAFLDIRMPGMTGIEVARRIADQCHVVFITAYDEYALQAFDEGAIDYVVKPAEVERLRRTADRLRARLASKETLPGEGARMQELLDRLAAQLGLPGRSAHLEWFQASVGQQIRMIAARDVLFLISDERYTRLQTREFEALIRKPIRELVQELDSRMFWQIHRSTLVNVNAIAGVARDDAGRKFVLIKDRSERLEVSRAYLHLFKTM